MNTLHILLAVPVISGILSFLISGEMFRRGLLLLTGLIHLVLSLNLLSHESIAQKGSWIALDSIGKLFLLTVTILFFVLAVYLFFAKDETSDDNSTKEMRFKFIRDPGKIFSACLNFFLAAMTLTVVSQHFGLQWIGIETTTLVSTPLIYLKRTKHSLEAAWKYLITCSVGISLALLGIFFLAMSMPKDIHSFTPANLVLYANYLNQQWLQIAFIFIIIGYGTKMGLAPMHTWLPDTYCEAPVAMPVLSTALTGCAFLGILRVYQVCLAAGLFAFASELLLLLGVLSIGIAAVFILHQVDYKRMLAYSSVEHMGILAFGLSLGGSAVPGVMLHVLCHSMIKASMFFSAGNIYRTFQTNRCDEVHDLKRQLPLSGALWLAGFFAITGTPPFATFLSEFIILRGALETRSYISATLYIIFLTMVFVGMLGIMLRMYSATGCGPHRREEKAYPENLMALLPSFILLSIAFILTFYAPEFLRDLINGASMSLGGKTL